MSTEVEDLKAHLTRYRGVTLQVLEQVTDDDLPWRPTPQQYSLGQQLLHIAQAEELYAHGLFRAEWDYGRVRFPAEIPDRAGIRARFEASRALLFAHLDRLDPTLLGEVVDIPGSPLKETLRSWLWFLVEHEMHHKAQVSVYLRLMGRTPPFYASPLPEGERPDIEARKELGGF